MAYTVILHVSGESSIAGEVDELPKPADTIIIVSNPRQKDGKDLHYIDNNVVKVIWPLARVSFIEILENAEEEKIIGFVRE
ncbi:MAG: hypothetical protein KA473_15120 [Anaerolineales bacterium]|nr:hypothetical protein [Anaerolineales bacterium]MBP6210763.1 hypothetical protein [Anaerolineales bacterium]MBP8164937.1 hypothetical protein [Anaerolineales bacterium]